MKTSKTEPPGHLSAESKKFWAEIISEYSIVDAAGLKILRVALEAFDRAQAAREAIDAAGMLLTDKYGQQKVNPLIACVSATAARVFLQG